MAQKAVVELSSADPGVDTSIKIGDETFNVLETPSSSSDLVKQQKDVILSGTDFEFLLTELSMVGTFLKMAHTGVSASVTAHSDLKAKIRRSGVNISRLCDQSTGMVADFRRSSRKNVRDLIATYQFLLDGMETMALKTLQLTATNAQGMADSAATLATAFDNESEQVESALKETTEAYEEDGRLQKKLEDKIRKYELEQAKAAEESAVAAKKLAFHDRQCEEIKASAQQERRNFLYALFDYVTGRKKKIVKARQEEKEMHEQSMEKLRMTRSRALENTDKWAKEMQNCQQERDIVVAAITSLNEAIISLKNISGIMRLLSTFWRRLEAECTELSSEDMVTMIKSAMQKKSKAERIKIWSSNGTKTKGIYDYTSWVALEKVCEEFLSRAKETQKELFDHLTEDLESEEALQQIREMAEKIGKQVASKKVSQSQQISGGRKSREQRMFEMQCAQGIAKKIFTEEYDNIHTIMSLNPSNFGKILYSAKFISKSTRDYATLPSTGVTNEEKAHKLLHACEVYVTAHSHPIERMEKFLEKLKQEPAADALAKRISQKLT